MDLLDIHSLAPPFDDEVISLPLTVHSRCLAATRVILQSLALPNMDSRNIVVVKVPLWDRVKKQGLLPATNGVPCILISPYGIPTAPKGEGTNARDDIGYPVTIGVFQSPDNDYTANLDTYLQWYQNIFRALRNQRPQDNQSDIALPEIMTVRVEPGSIVELSLWQQGIWASFFVVRFISREVRGLDNINT